MPQIVTSKAEEIRSAARAAGLIPVDGKLSCGNLPVLRWTGNWPDFLELAKAAGARLVYLDLVEFHAIETMIANVTEFLDDLAPPIHPEGSPDFVDQVYHRLEEVMRPWHERDGEPARLVCTWVTNGVAHVWKAEQKWYIECRQAIEQALDELYDQEVAVPSTV